MRAEYRMLVSRSPAMCTNCYTYYGDAAPCVECTTPAVYTVTILNLGVGQDGGRANIKFDDGRIKNVAVDTLRLLDDEEEKT